MENKDFAILIGRHAGTIAQEIHAYREEIKDVASALDSIAESLRELRLCITPTNASICQRSFLRVGSETVE